MNDAIAYCRSLGIDPFEKVWGRTFVNGVHHWFQMERWKWYVRLDIP